MAEPFASHPTSWEELREQFDALVTIISTFSNVQRGRIDQAADFPGYKDIGGGTKGAGYYLSYNLHHWFPWVYEGFKTIDWDSIPPPAEDPGKAAPIVEDPQETMRKLTAAVNQLTAALSKVVPK